MNSWSVSWSSYASKDPALLLASIHSNKELAWHSGSLHGAGKPAQH
jgi:hypothetical protein